VSLTHKPETASSNLALGTKEKPANLRVFILFWRKAYFFTLYFLHIYERETFGPLTLSLNLAYCDCAPNLWGLKSIPTPHDFRRAFALIMLRNGVDIFALQKLMGHSDLHVLRHYLAQTDADVHTAHM
jgi:integrase